MTSGLYLLSIFYSSYKALIITLLFISFFTDFTIIIASYFQLCCYFIFITAKYYIFTFLSHCKALNSRICADVPLTNYSLTHSGLETERAYGILISALHKFVTYFLRRQLPTYLTAPGVPRTLTGHWIPQRVTGVLNHAKLYCDLTFI